MDAEFDAWRRDRRPETLRPLLTAAEPVLRSALQSFAGGDPSLSGRARVLAAKAFESYDPSRGANLRTWLMHSLRPLGRYAQARRQTVRVPEKSSVDLWRLGEETRKFRDETGREPSDLELADRTGLAVRRILKLRRFGSGEMSESSVTRTNEDGEQEIWHPGVGRASPQDVWLEYVHHDLPAIDQKILEWRTGLFGKEVLPNQEIASRLGLSPGRVSQRAARIQARIREYSAPAPKPATPGEGSESLFAPEE